MFKPPSNIPQDLLMIHDLVGSHESLAPKGSQHSPDGDDPLGIDSSDTDSIASPADSAGEIEATLAVQPQTDGPAGSKSTQPPSDSDSSDDSSDSSSSDDEPVVQPLRGEDEEEEETDVNGTSSSKPLQTKNELLDIPVAIPEFQTVASDEVIEKVGEVMSIVDNVVIVKGLASQVLNRGSENALDSDSLLVFEDRAVLGYVYETFGPTQQPMYQVRFNSSFPLNPEIVRVSRQVFHLPNKSKYVFAKQLRMLKGSDASNVHDEEVGDEEIEFSDDEAEAEFKRRRKHGRESSATLSRESSVAPSHHRDQDLVDFSGVSPYDEHGPYDMDYSTLPPRPPPIPYDDPYAPEPSNTASASSSTPSQTTYERRPERDRLGAKRTSPARREGRFQPRGRGRGRGQGRRPQVNDRPSSSSRGGHNGPKPRSPTSSPTTPFPPQNFQPAFSNNAADSFAGHSNHGPQHPPVQPHINPRFAPYFGIPMPPNMHMFTGPQAAQYYNAYAGNYASSTGMPWSNGWQQQGDYPYGYNAPQNEFEVPPSDGQTEYRP